MKQGVSAIWNEKLRKLEDSAKFRCVSAIHRSVTTGNMLDENRTMFCVSVAFLLAKMCQLVYNCVSANSFERKFCGF